MKNYSLLYFFISFSLLIFSLPSLSVTLESEVITDISKRSHIPVEKLKTLFSDCDKAINQLDMDLCSDKDATTVIFKLRETLLNKKLELLACQTSLKEKIAQWQRLRNKGCKNIKEDYSGGMIRAFLEMTCLAHETNKMIKKFDKINNYNEINKITEPLQINSLTNSND